MDSYSMSLVDLPINTRVGKTPQSQCTTAVSNTTDGL